MTPFTKYIPGLGNEKAPAESDMIRWIANAHSDAIEASENVLGRIVEKLPPAANSNQTAPGKINFTPGTPAYKSERTSNQTPSNETRQRVANGALQATSHQEAQQQVIYDAGVEAARQSVDDAFAGSN
jgi:hypothetical protein